MMLTMADSNRNGYVEYDEFEKVLRSNNGGSGGVMNDVFKAMDDDTKVCYGDFKTTKQPISKLDFKTTK